MINIEECPTLRPTQQEFENFYEYIEKIDKQYSADFGMVKVIPPKNFRVRLQDYNVSLDNLIIHGPIEQNVYGKGGNYECLHILKKSMPLKDYRNKQLEIDKQHEKLTSDQYEKLYWKSLAFSPPLYGADIKLSLMEVNNSWNLNNVTSLLNYGLKNRIPGVNEPYIYVGSWKTFFAWHKEDLDLCSVNYLHVGKDKFWYSIPETDSHLLEKYAKQTYGDHFNKCSEFLRHKTTVINPYLLKEKVPGIRISKMAHHEGEFMFIFAGAYHQGFNCGFNIAEAVNLATLNWLPLLLKAKICKCVKDNVKIDLIAFAENLQKSPLFKDNEKVLDFVEKAKDMQKILHKPIKKVKM
ncbi:unnamed protein product [Paramecium pentaurelia]|uniref:JmjC domain-containing protein n=1 Tax=Paramecium pentaurelia TaxID=43138 RepID=A0A8S1Y4R2_9CILI|nr:unnamed protein product [Paramecium pentaurelia]